MTTTSFLFNQTPLFGTVTVKFYIKDTNTFVDEFDADEFAGNTGRYMASVIDLPTADYDFHIETAGGANLGNGVLEHTNTEGLVEYPKSGGTTTLVVNSTAPVLTTVDAAGKLTIHRGDYTTFDLTLGSLVGRSGKKLVFTIKPKKGDLTDDSDCYLQVTEVDGAVLINGSADGVVASDASMTVLDQATGHTRFVLKSDLTNLLPIGSNFHYDVQMFDAAGERITKVEDRAIVNRDVTRRAV